MHLATAMRWSALVLLTSLASLTLLGQTASPPASTLTIPADAGIVTKLTTPLDLRQCKVGDAVEAQTTEDLKAGKEVLLKKGSALVGHVSLVEPPTPQQTETMVGIVFDKVKPKNGADQSVVLLIRALAPELGGPTNGTLSEGRGMPGATDTAVVPGHASGEAYPGGQLRASSVGVTGIPNLRIGSRKSSKGPATTILAISGAVTLKKGTQVVFKVPAQ